MVQGKVDRHTLVQGEVDRHTVVCKGEVYFGEDSIIIPDVSFVFVIPVRDVFLRICD